MTLERGKIRARGHRRRRYRRRRHLRRERRGAARRNLSWRGTVEFVLAGGDFGDRGIERGRTDRRRRAVDLGCRALDHLGLALLVLLGVARRLRIGDLRQPRVEARDRVVQLPRHGRLVSLRAVARRIVARGGAGNLVDLAGDRIQPLMDIGDVPGLLRWILRYRPLRGPAKIRRGGIAECGIQPVV